MEDFCRLCGLFCNTESMKHFFHPESNHILQKINYLKCFTFMIGNDDGFSPYLCERCITLVNRAHEFKLLCEAANSIFANKSQMKSVNVSEVNNDGDTDKTNPIIQMKCHETSPQTETITLMPTTDNSVGKRRRGKNNFVCSICNVKFRRTRDLARHTKNVHTDQTDTNIPKSDRSPTQWICDICGVVYKSRHSLVYHINGNHVDVVEKKYSCEICGYRCREKRNLITHSRTHTGERPFKCKYCDMAFTVHSALFKHTRSIHTKDAVKRFQCHICGKSYDTSNKHREHMFVHTDQLPYQCPQCPRTYRYMCGLMKHMKKRHPGVTRPSIKIFRKQSE